MSSFLLSFKNGITPETTRSKTQ